MRALILSDSHGLEVELQSIRERHADVDLYIHCGDSELDKDDAAMKGYKSVAGNCDWSQYPNTLILPFGDLKIFVTHGHLYNVKMTELNLLYKAEEVGANIVCFGHTHVAGVEEIKNIITLNPGSIRLPRGRKEPTYAILDWDQPSRTLTVTFHHVNGQPIDDFSSSYQL